MTMNQTQIPQAIFWRPLAWFGLEQVFVKYEDVEEDPGYIIDGTILAMRDGEPVRTSYLITLDADWRFDSLWLHHASEVSWPHDFELVASELRIDDDGSWRHRNFEQVADLTGCVDIDITLTPMTNTLPIRRLQLEEGQSAEIRVAWIHLPELTIENARQRYTLLQRTSTGARYRFEGLDSGFQADLDIDDNGFVTDYPNLWERIG